MTDAVGLGIFLASLIYAPSVAAVIGPYLVIIICSVLGASFAVKRREKTTRTAAFTYFLRVAGVATMITVGLAQVVAKFYDGWDERALIAPIALLIGGAGDDFPELLRAAVRKAFALLDTVRPKGPK